MGALTRECRWKVPPPLLSDVITTLHHPSQHSYLALVCFRPLLPRPSSPPSCAHPLPPPCFCQLPCAPSSIYFPPFSTPSFLSLSTPLSPTSTLPSISSICRLDPPTTPSLHLPPSFLLQSPPPASIQHKSLPSTPHSLLLPTTSTPSHLLSSAAASWSCLLSPFPPAHLTSCPPPSVLLLFSHDPSTLLRPSSDHPTDLLPPSYHHPPIILPPPSHRPPTHLPHSSHSPPTLLRPSSQTSSHPLHTLLAPSSHPPCKRLPPTPDAQARSGSRPPALHSLAGGTWSALLLHRGRQLVRMGHSLAAACLHPPPRALARLDAG